MHIVENCNYISAIRWSEICNVKCADWRQELCYKELICKELLSKYYSLKHYIDKNPKLYYD